MKISLKELQFDAVVLDSGQFIHNIFMIILNEYTISLLQFCSQLYFFYKKSQTKHLYH